jgi:hypothetical protein
MPFSCLTTWHSVVVEIFIGHSSPSSHLLGPFKGAPGTYGPMNPWHSPSQPYVMNQVQSMVMTDIWRRWRSLAKFDGIWPLW